MAIDIVARGLATSLLDNNGKIYVQEKNNPFISFNSNYNKGGQW